MHIPQRTIDHGTLRRLIDAGARVSADVVAGADGWGVIIQYGRDSHTLVASRDQVQTFRQFETLLAYLRDLDIVEIRVSTGATPSAPTGSSPVDE